MTIIRTPRKWPGYRTNRRMYWAGNGGAIVSLPQVQERDFSDIIRAARMAVDARNNHGWGESRPQTVLHHRDVADVEVVQPEKGRAVVVTWRGYESLAMSDLTVRVNP